LGEFFAILLFQLFVHAITLSLTAYQILQQHIMFC